MANGADIYIDTEYNVLFISVGEKMTEESIMKLKEGLHNNDNPYDGVYVMENINSVQYISE